MQYDYESTYVCIWLKICLAWEYDGHAPRPLEAEHVRVVQDPRELLTLPGTVLKRLVLSIAGLYDHLFMLVWRLFLLDVAAGVY